MKTAMTTYREMIVGKYGKTIQVQKCFIEGTIRVTLQYRTMFSPISYQQSYD